MEERTYLKWYNKIGYGSGDIAGNVVYAFLSSFVMLYLTNSIGLNAGIVGSLIAVSKLFDGVTDVFFGAMIDKTHSKMGKARPWMFYGYFGCALTLIGIFAIPVNLGETAQYAWFFITYTLLNAVFYTANNIAYSALTSLVTKNSKERVQMGSFRFMFAFATSLLIQSITLQVVSWLGGGANGWRTIAIIYAVIGLVINSLSVFSVKELPEEELAEEDAKAGSTATGEKKYSLVEAMKLLVANKYYLMICGAYILQQIYTAMLNMGVYFMTYVLLNENLYGVFSWFINIPLIVALVFTPMLVAKWKGMYKLNVASYTIATIGRALVILAAYLGSVPLMLLFTAVAAFGQGPWQGDMNAVIASCSEYTWLTKHKRVDGTMYSCTSLGIKLGGGIGTAVAGWLLAASGFDGKAAVQAPSTINMLYVMYLWIPFAINLLITLILSRLNVEKANRELRDGHI
ncbi:MAG: MFS transporter [Ruminococcus sp.]|nr:MFS transporter [Ruminococcus sp.]